MKDNQNPAWEDAAVEWSPLPSEEDPWSEEEQEMLRLAGEAWLEATHEKLERSIAENPVSPRDVPCARRFKIRWNRLFREAVGGSYIPFPEVETP